MALDGTGSLHFLPPTLGSQSRKSSPAVLLWCTAECDVSMAITNRKREAALKTETLSLPNTEKLSLVCLCSCWLGRLKESGLLT